MAKRFHTQLQICVSDSSLPQHYGPALTSHGRLIEPISTSTGNSMRSNVTVPIGAADTNDCCRIQVEDHTLLATC